MVAASVTSQCPDMEYSASNPPCRAVVVFAVFVVFNCVCGVWTKNYCVFFCLIMHNAYTIVGVDGHIDAQA